MSTCNFAILYNIEEVVGCDSWWVRPLNEVHHLLHAHHWDLMLHHQAIDWVNKCHEDALRLVSSKVCDSLWMYVRPLHLSQTTEDETGSQELLLQPTGREVIVEQCRPIQQQTLWQFYIRDTMTPGTLWHQAHFDTRDITTPGTLSTGTLWHQAHFDTRDTLTLVMDALTPGTHRHQKHYVKMCNWHTNRGKNGNALWKLMPNNITLRHWHSKKRINWHMNSPNQIKMTQQYDSNQNSFKNATQSIIKTMVRNHDYLEVLSNELQ